MRLDLTPRQFYLTGVACFVVIGLAQFAGLIINFSILGIFEKIINTGQVIFSIALVGLFRFLVAQEPKLSTVSASDDIDQIIKEISKDNDEYKPKHIRV